MWWTASSTSWSPSVEAPTRASTLPTACRRVTNLAHRLKACATLLCVWHRPSACAVFVAGLLAAQTTRSVWDGVYTSAQAQRGAALYANNCASCHGTALGGGESAPPLTGGEFSSNWYGLTVGDLFERIRTTMPANRPGRLT